jgi:amino acid transporter
MASPVQHPAPAPVYEEQRPPLGLRVKNVLLGRPLRTADLAHERLGRPTALAVFASDNLSSSAYATEEILRHLIPYIGLAAFSLVVPITAAMLAVLAFLILSYRQTIRAYPTAGGAYMVTRDNFGLMPAQVAGAALLTDYVLTVSVSVAAGTDAITSAVAPLRPWHIVIACTFIVFIAYGNLRGVRESGKMFALPTYFFIADMVLLLGIGTYRMLVGGLPIDPGGHPGLINYGRPGSGLLLGATLFVVLRAFASGGAAVTGVEAISNGVSAFRVPEWKNARSTLVVMGSLLGVMFLGLSILAARTHVSVYETGVPTVISQVGRLVYGGGPVGAALYGCLQVGTALILILAANTSFADFPRLASFHAGDSFFPKQFTKRGHRLVFSTGIISLAVAAIVLLIATEAKVDRLIPLYAIGVFTSFTLSQSGMAKHHLTHKEEGWRYGLVINGVGAVLSAVVDIVIAMTKFSHGAWVVLIAVPVIVLLLARTNRIYKREHEDLAVGIQATLAPPLPRHRVVVLVDDLDRSTLAALQYARQLRPLSTVAVHVAIDPAHAAALQERWAKAEVPFALEIVDCPHRDLVEEVGRYVRELTAQPGTEVTVLVPCLRYSKPWHRLLHDSTARSLTGRLSGQPHVNLTIVPFAVGAGRRELRPVR